ncbi:MAG TPA: DUF4440 domain-containing protein, partial [Capsulimonadaceae bacterium]|nr:DUF4440 domain-containing protein [Capsulimonadaceae bacterium]
MKYLRYLTALVLLVAFAAPALTKGHAGASQRRSMQEIYARMDKAADHKDVDRFVAFYDPDYRELRNDGTEIEYQSFVAQTTSVFSHASKINTKTTVQSVQSVSGGVVVVTRTHAAITLKDPRTGKMVTVQATEDDRDFWVQDTGS